MIFDLHSHTSHSDGSLITDDLLERAAANNVAVLAITDHDTVEAHLCSPGKHHAVTLLAGVEFSTQWENTGIHVLGLNIDPASEAMTHATRLQSEARYQRAEQISANLKKLGIENALQGARQHAPGHYLGRPHFARYLVESGRSHDMAAAFKKYLGAGKAGDVRQHWAELPTIVEWIRAANGIAVLAHPLKYKLTRTRLKRLLSAFKQAGGEGMEVVSGQQTTQQTADMARLCELNGMLASCGSDFHMPGKPWAELGAFTPLPDYLTPVWERF